MKKTIKKFLTLFLSLIMVFSIFATAVFTTASASEEEPQYLMLEDFENISDWISQHPDSTLSRDSVRKTQGDYSMRARLSPEATARGDQMLLLYEAMETMDLSGYDYFEFDLMLDKVDEFLSPKGELVMQLNVIDPDSGGQDGFNHLIVLSKADTPVNQWIHIRVPLQKTGAVVGNTSITHISKIRIAFFNVTDPISVQELNLNFDRLMFYNSTFETAREEEQTRVDGLASALTVPTESNYKDLSTQILAAETAYKQMLTNYPGAQIDSQENYDAVISAYYSFAKADMIANTEGLITAIGEVTQANYLDKSAPIEAAEASVTELKSLYGAEVVPSNLATLTAARTTYDNISAAEAVITAIKALPAVEALTADNADAVGSAKSSFDKLTEEQKAYVSTEDAATLDAAVKRIYDILHPYTLGDVDENGDVTANDALLALQHSVQKITLEGNKLLAADVDGNGNITANDALVILQYSVKKINEWPKAK